MLDKDKKDKIDIDRRSGQIRRERERAPNWNSSCTP